MKKYIPDMITSMNLLCGVIGVVFAFKGRIDLSFIFMLAAATADFLDGLAARALNAYSDLGKELDSLSWPRPRASPWTSRCGSAAR